MPPFLSNSLNSISDAMNENGTALSRFDMLIVVQDYSILRAKLQANNRAILFSKLVESDLSASRKPAEAGLLTSKIPSL